MNEKNAAIKRIVALSCLGIDIYMLVLYAVQVGMAEGGNFLISWLPDMMDYADMMNGLCMIAAVLSGAVLLWLYVQETYDGELKNVVLCRHRRFCLRACISFAALMYVTQLLALIVQSVAELIFNTIGYTVLESPAADMDYTAGKVILLYALLIGPIIEELVFRGFLLNALRPCGKAYAVLISAVMFSLMHADIEQIFFTFAAGLILGYVAAEYSIWASLLLHIINNGIYGELLLYMQEVLPEAAYVIIALILMLGSIVLGIVLAVRYRGRLKTFVKDNPTAPGAYAALKNRWFVAFAACMIGLTWMTVTRL